jgi:DNA (cytosine-5)-methyltransferase 1
MLRVVETFSGIGSQAKALKKANIQHEILATIEWDINAILAYDLIHNGPQDFSSYEELSKKELIEELSKYAISNDGKNPIKPRSLSIMSRDSLISILIAIKRTKNLINITEVHGDDLPDEIDVLTYSFPCQDLSICGLWHGNVSGIKKGIKNRSGMLWEIERILYELKSEKKALPRFLLMENVSNILSKRHIDDFKQWLNYLEDIGYHNKVYNLNSLNFGVPQNRKRTFMISVLKDDVLNKEYLERYFDNNNLENVKMNLNSLEDYLRLDYRKKIYRNEAIESNPNKTPSRDKIYEENLLIFDGKNVITKYANTITTKQDRNPNSGVIKFNHLDKKSDYRNLTPRECFLLMGFEEEDFQKIINNNVLVKSNYSFFTMQKLIKLAGNSIVVDILESIFIQINDLKNISMANYME